MYIPLNCNYEHSYIKKEKEKKTTNTKDYLRDDGKVTESAHLRKLTNHQMEELIRIVREDIFPGRNIQLPKHYNDGKRKKKKEVKYRWQLNTLLQKVSPHCVAAGHSEFAKYIRPKQKKSAKEKKVRTLIFSLLSSLITASLFSLLSYYDAY